MCEHNIFLRIFYYILFYIAIKRKSHFIKWVVIMILFHKILLTTVACNIIGSGYKCCSGNTLHMGGWVLMIDEK